MATQTKLRRGTYTENNAFTGAEGEITIDTTNDTIRVHDGSTQGGHVLMKGNSPVTPATHTKITYDAKGLITGGSELTASDIPDLSEDYVVKNTTPLTPGTKAKITYDAKGLVTGGADLSATDIPELPTSKITGLTTALDGKMPQIPVVVPSSSSGSVILAIDACNVVNMSGSVSFTMPTVTDNTVFHQILVQLYKPSAGYTVTLGPDKYFAGVVPTIDAIGYYNIYYEWNKARGSNGAWEVGAIYKGS